MQPTALVVILLLFVLSVVHAGTPLFSFENDDEITVWRARSPQQDTLARVPEFASAGRTAMRFHTPQWREGMEQWPAFEAKPPVQDWRAFDRLIIDVTNPGPREFFSVFISDSKVPFREGLSFGLTLPERGFKRYVVPLSFPEKVNKGDIAILHFFSQRPTSEMALYLDNLVLLKPGEQAPALPATFLSQIAQLAMGNLDVLEQQISQHHEALRARCRTEQQRAGLQLRIGGLQRDVKAAREAATSPDLTTERLAELQAELPRLPQRLQRVEAMLQFELAFDETGLPSDRLLVGFASSMEKVLPRDVSCRPGVSRRVHLSLARNEKESFQVLVTPRTGTVKGVQVSVTDLRTPGGAVLSAEHVNCDVVGYVETKTRPPYQVSYVGWWPDPILDFLGPVEVKEGDLQSFWVRVRAPRDQAPGLYRGKLQVAAEGTQPLSFDLSVRVYPFALPDCTPLPTAITFFEHPDQMGGKGRWPQMKMAYADFLADYYIDYDSLYRSGPPDFEILRHLHDRGQLCAFNLGNVFNGGAPEENFEQEVAKVIERLRPGYEQAKQLGLLDHAYIYGFDERGADQFPLLERCAQELRKAFPEVVLMTTSYDASYGMASVVNTMDAWCPLTPSFVPAKAEQARAAGKYVWWYICCGPHNPFANWFVEYAAIESRLLMGAMAARQRPDGFLYYSLSIWNQNKPIQSGPFTDWNPVSWTTYHGDGSLFCSGADGKPVPTIRLENYRDGQEDYAYAVILEHIIRAYEARPSLTGQEREWLAEAKAALRVPEKLMKTMSDYSHDPAVLYAWRDRVAEAISASGMTDMDPWGKDFGVRGFRR